MEFKGKYRRLFDEISGRLYQLSKKHNLSDEIAELHTILGEIDKYQSQIEKENALVYDILSKTDKSIIESQEHRWSSIFSAIKDVILLLDNSGFYLKILPTRPRNIYKPVTEMLGKSVFEILPVDIAEKFMAAIKKSLTYLSTETITYTLWIEGQEFWFEGKISPVSEDIVVFVGRDITEHVLSKQKIENQNNEIKTQYENLEKINHFLGISEEKNRVLIQLIPDMIFLQNREGVYKKAHFPTPNRAVRHPNDFEGKNMNDILPKELCRDFKNLFEIAIQTGRVQRYEYTVDDNNHRKYYEARILNNGDDEILSIIRDITELKDAEKELIKAKNVAEEASRIKSEFLANTSHEIRTPMNAILGFTEILKDNIKDAQSREYLEGIHTSAKNLLNLINDILDLSKIEAGRFTIENEPTDLSLVLNEIASIFGMKIKQKGLEFRIVKPATQLPLLLLDQKRLTQILVNLVGNAVKFTSNGFVELTLEIKRNRNNNTASVLFKIKDSGIGIPENMYEAIFDPFRQQDGKHTRQFEGTGLGLSISRKLVSLMNGKIDVSSQVGIGSEFRMHLFNIEVTKNESTENQKFDSVELQNLNGLKILLVEDNILNRKVVAGFLKQYDITIKEATNGKEAIEALADFYPSFILMDMQMPVMNGFEATKYIKTEMDEKFRKIPIIALTAVAMKEEVEKIDDLCDGYIIKPITKENFIQTIYSLFSQSSEL